MGGDTSIRLGLVQKLFQLSAQKTLKEEVKAKFSDLFTGLGTLPVQYHLELDPEVTPVMNSPRRVPAAVSSRVRVELDRSEAEVLLSRYRVILHG